MHKYRHIIFTQILFFISTLSAGISLALQGSESRKEGRHIASEEAFSPNPLLTLISTRIDETVKLDGSLEPLWLKGARADNFVEVQPGENTPPQVRTEAYFLNDDENLYFAFVCYDPDIRRLRASLSERDAFFHDDFAGIIFDPYGDHQTGYEFFVNPFGIQGDLIRDINGNENTSYDAVWYSEGKIYDDRWIVEARIPFKSLRFPYRHEQTWRIHLLRVYPRESRYQISWMPFSRDNNSFFGQAGYLKFELGRITQSRLELLPYLIGSGERQRTSSNNVGYWKSSRWDAHAGINAKYGLSSTITLDFAYNPDFSQIEADAGQIDVNNTFALFFSEKRPFFLEGNDIFRMMRFCNYIYTRTINDPLVAFKITGKTGRLTFGVISAYDEQTPFIMPFEFRSIVLKTHWNSWNNIVRTKYAFGEERFIGLSATHRLLEDGKGNQTLALDANWRFNDNYTFKTLAALTHTREPDQLTYSRETMDSLTFQTGGKTYDSYFNGESFMGWLLSASVERNARYWSYTVNYNEISPGFRNDASYLVSNHYRQVSIWSGYTFYYDNHPVLNRITPQFNFSRKYNFDGRLNDFWITPSLSIQFQKQTGLNLAVMVINNEYFRTRQFSRMHRAWINFWTEAWKYLHGGFYLAAGKYINRRGEEGNPHNPFTLADGVQSDIWVTLKPRPFLSHKINFSGFHLWTRYGSSKIVSQKIIRNESSIQITRELSFRLIGEMILTERVRSDEPVMKHSRYFSIDPLLSYKVNPFTVFYVGAHIGGEKDPYPNLQGLQATRQNVFAKFQYLFRV